ncbi:MAG: hypothetical protein FWC79_05380 [Oscillospiraceae bacterium]|nr:hypothetical protein [Oscillospiraceae bacterium]
MENSFKIFNEKKKIISIILLVIIFLGIMERSGTVKAYVQEETEEVVQIEPSNFEVGTYQLRHGGELPRVLQFRLGDGGWSYIMTAHVYHYERRKKNACILY